MLSSTTQHQPVVADLADFDKRSGSWGERLLFNNRYVVLLICALATMFLGYEATRLKLNASYEGMMPTHHVFIENYLANKDNLAGAGDTLQITVETTKGTIYDSGYLQTLRAATDDASFLPYVDKQGMRSLWTSSTRWLGVTEDGLEGGPVMPDDFDGSPRSLDEVKANVERSGEIGRLVANNFKSSVIVLPLVSFDAATRKPIDYGVLSQALDQLRDKYTTGATRIHITGFAKIQGDLIGGLREIMIFFMIAIAITMSILYWYTRCIRSTLLVVSCSIVAVIWQLGLLPLVGRQLTPFSILVPFLIFAIGMSHGAQKMNGIMQDIGRGTHRLVAARYTFRRLFMTGLIALLCDTVGFAVLVIIKIPVIQELAVVASLGVTVLIFTNLILLPVLLSFTGVSKSAALRSLRAESSDRGDPAVWRFVDRFTEARPATIALLSALILAAVGVAIAQHLKVGDLDAGAPELRASSRYNQDAAFAADNYAQSSDQLIVMVKTPEFACGTYTTLALVDQLELELRQLPSVVSTNSLSQLAKHMVIELNEGSLKWYELVRTQPVLNAITSAAPHELFTESCDTLPIFVYLKDHKADTLSEVVNTVEHFSAKHDTQDVKFLLAAGPGGVQAATNIVVERALSHMLIWVYSAVIALCFLTFRSWRAVICAVLPLMLTSILCEALMVMLGIGVKVATLPVIALGVGIGVDYALYVLAIMLARMNEGYSVSESFHLARRFTGKVVMLTGLTLACAVVTWVFSPIKFQADMGLLLTFMFLWNMLGALILLPALAHFILKPTVDVRRERDPAKTGSTVSP
jgi:uncharacterized protein